jgi:1,4-dihydroxy-2-naphthoate octaprenyltransferase
MDSGFPATNSTPSQTEPPVPPDAYDTVSSLSGMADPTSTAGLPRKTLPLPPVDMLPHAGSATVAREQALVATGKRGGLPLALVAPPSPAARWWRVLRPGQFWLSLLPVALGTATARFEPSKTDIAFHPMRLLGLILVVLLLHAGANLLNEYYDVRRGTDGEHALGSSGILQKNLLPAEAVRRTGLIMLAVGALWLLIEVLVAHTWGVLLWGGAAALLAYFYSATPYALGYLPLGELALGFVMGPAVLLSSVEIQGAQVSALAVAFSLALGSLAAAATLANNLRDLETDRAANKRTLVTYLGVQLGRMFYLVLVLLPYLLIALAAFPHARPHGILLVLLTLPALVVVITGVLRAETPAATNVVVAQTLRLHRNFGLLLLAGYLISIAVIVLPHALGF